MSIKIAGMAAWPITKEQYHLFLKNATGLFTHVFSEYCTGDMTESVTLKQLNDNSCLALSAIQVDEIDTFPVYEDRFYYVDGTCQDAINFNLRMQHEFTNL